MFGSTAVCHPVLIIAPLARGRSYRRNRNPCYFLLLTAAPAAIFTSFASTIAAYSTALCAYSVISAASTFSVASAVAAMFSTPSISVRLLLTSGHLKLAALQGRVSCAGAKVASDGGVIVTAVAAGVQHRFAPGGKFFAFQPVVLVFHSTLDLFPRRQPDELSSMRTSASYCSVSPLRMTMSMFFGYTGRFLAPVPSILDPSEAGNSVGVLPALFSSYINHWWDVGAP